MLNKLLGVAVFAMILFIAYAVWQEATFDYTKCQATNQYRDRHQASWVQHMPRVCSGNPTVCTGGYTIVHPARNWTERLYRCPTDEGQRYDKWRNENRP